MTSFWDKVNKSGECWEWTLFRMPKGYGQVTVKGEKWLAHRYAYFLAYGEIPEGMQVLHECDNPPCCRPAHLFTGTNLDNVIDMMSKRRNPQGETHHNAKLTADDVAFIRASDLSNAELAEIFNVHWNTPYRIRKGLRRLHG